MADNSPMKLGDRVAVSAYTVHRTRHAKHIQLFIGAELLPNGEIGNICIDFTNSAAVEDLLAFCRKHIKKGSKVVSTHFPANLRYHDKSFIYEEMQSKTYDYRVFLPPIFEIVRCLEDHHLLRTQQLSSSRAHMKSYLDECSYKFNNSKLTFAEIFENILYTTVRSDPLSYNEIVR